MSSNDANPPASESTSPQEQADRLAHDNDNIFRMIFEQSAMAIVVADASGRVVQCNPAFEALLGYSEAELRSMYFADFTHPDDLASELAVVEQVLGRQRDGYEMEKRYVRKDGQTRWISLRSRVLETHAGRPWLAIGMIEDITERRQAELTLAESEHRYRQHFENVADILISYDRNLVLTGISPSVERILGLRPDQLIGIRLGDSAVSDAETVGRLRELAGRVLAGEREITEITVRATSGNLVVLELHMSAMREGDAVAGLVVIARDVTDRKRAEEQLRRSEARNRALIEAIPDVMYSISRDGIYGELISDRGFAPIYPWAEHYQGRHIRDVMPPASADRAEEVIRQTFETGRTQCLEYEVVDPRNKQVYYREIRCTVSGPDELLCLVRDVTDRKQTEHKLAHSEAMHRGLLEAIPDSKFRVGRDGELIEFIPGVEPPARDPGEFLGRNIADVLPPEVAGRCIESYIAALTSRQVQTMEYRLAVPLPDGPVQDYEARIAPCGPDEAFVLVRNITDRKHAERQLHAMAAQLSLAEERERRQIAAELHDRIGQALALANMQLGQIRNAALPPAARQAVNQVLELIEQSLEDTRNLTFELSPPILYELGLEPAIEWLTEQVAGRYSVRVEFHDDQGGERTIGEDVRVALFQACRELLVNAAKHAAPRRIIVSLHHRDGHVGIEVADDGRGFEPADISNGRRGFGLFSVRERLAPLGGRLEIDSAPGRGSRLTAWGPIVRD